MHCSPVPVSEDQRGCCSPSPVISSHTLKQSDECAAGGGAPCVPRGGRFIGNVGQETVMQKWHGVSVARRRADFDKDKNHPWAGEILRTRNSADKRISVLLKTAAKHLKGALRYGGQ